MGDTGCRWNYVGREEFGGYVFPSAEAKTGGGEEMTPRESAESD